ncbi:S9 family peptidase [Pacificimonas sp. WHA3]|uniref:S9 family peptidase n=1 Tax=Pacificimonas pallii TaxID=2827236 RepID=A0ABS6SA28_9SPHN|nr:S9 family peptidase [Pacificimonas pallii]MBV7255230.1 S9 family peptidase [Pacificimonas pallii]
MATSDLPSPPVAEVRPSSFTRHGITVQDPYAWLRDRKYPEVDDAGVLAYLNAENAYFEAAMAPHDALVETLFEELKGRVKKDDASVPQKDGDYEYWWAFQEGAQYRTWYRRPVGTEQSDVLLDEPALAAGKDYFRIGMFSVSPDGKLLAYASDDNGSERYTLHIKNLETGELLPDRIENVFNIVWAADSAGFIYTIADENWRSKVVLHHELGGGDPREIYRESDPEFSVGIGLSQSRSWAILSTGTNTTSEVRLLPAADFTAAPMLVSARDEGREYDLDERDGTLFIRVNDTHPNFRLVTAPAATPGEWSELIAGSDDHYLRSVTSFRDILVIEERIGGLSHIRLRDYDGGGETRVRFPEASYDASLGNNPEYAQTKLRIDYESMVTPDTVYDYDLASGALEVLKVQEIPSGYDADNYVTERLTATARDGTKVPLSIVYRKDFPKDGSRPVHLYAYGAYGYAVPPGFSSARLSLLDRGYGFAIAHVRGGDDLGYEWYLDGKLKKRTNTFNDFIDVARHLVKEGYTSEGRIAASGGSAGGELMGAVINQAPELFGAVAAHVPFVDVLNTMLDDTLPLTPGEWQEWGNPIEDAEAFKLLLSYSPYDQVSAQDYPPLLITAGLNDPRVTYWEPAKWAARLRATKTDDNILLLKTNMGAGHGGKSGRFDSLREKAEEQAFFLTQIKTGE